MQRHFKRLNSFKRRCFVSQAKKWFFKTMMISFYQKKTIESKPFNSQEGWTRLKRETNKLVINTKYIENENYQNQSALFVERLVENQLVLTLNLVSPPFFKSKISFCFKFDIKFSKLINTQKMTLKFLCSKLYSLGTKW